MSTEKVKAISRMVGTEAANRIINEADSAELALDDFKTHSVTQMPGLAELLAALMHYANFKNISFDDALTHARMTHRNDREDGGDLVNYSHGGLK